MKTTFLKTSLLAFALSASVASAFGDNIPYVYDKENTGTSYQVPNLKSIKNQIATGVSIAPLPDPFAWIADPLGKNPARSTSFADWEKHRQEYLALFQQYEIGKKPTVDASQITASFSGSTLTVKVTVGANSLTLTSTVSFPSGGTNPYPIVIGMNSGTGSITASDFSTRGIATLAFSHDQVTKYGGPANTDPFFVLYPDQNIDNTGQYAAWAWGVSRLIDGLYKLNGVLGDKTIDLSHICVTGCSYAGKMALYCGAFDERVALTIAQESGGGGATSWRYSNTQSGVEGLPNTDYKWFKDSMITFQGANMPKIPTDHHMLNALVAPRALLATGNTDYEWLSNLSHFVNSKATKKIYDQLGISDRFGYVIDGGHGHCAVPSSQETQIGYFLDKFMKGNTTLSQTYEVRVNALPKYNFDTVQYDKWTSWWGTGVPAFPAMKAGGNEYHYYEAERFVSKAATGVGRDFSIVFEDTVSNGGFIASYTKGFTTAAPTDSADMIVIPFTAAKDTLYNIFAHVNGRNGNSNSFWMKIDNGSWAAVAGWYTNGIWLWRQFARSISLTAGAHKLYFGIRQANSKLDKVIITNHNFAPVWPSLGDTDPLAVPITAQTALNPVNTEDGVVVYPTTVTNTLTIDLANSADAISLFNSAGQQILNMNTANKNVTIDMSTYNSGVYLLKINTGNQLVTKKIVKK